MRHLLAVAVLSVVAVSAVHAETYEIDAAHSEVGFKVKHLVGRVPGRFKTFSGTIDYTPGKPETWKVDAKIDPASIDTSNEKRDGHLKSPDFFDTAKYPEMTFKSTKVTADKLTGDLTMHGVTKSVTLDLEVGGVTKDPWGNTKAGFSARGKLNRKDWGIIWNKTLDTGSLMLGEDIDISLEVEAAAAAPKPAEKKEAPKKAEKKAK